MKPRCGQDRVKKAFLVKSLEMWTRKGQESFLGEISSLETQDEAQDVAKIGS